MKETPKSGNIQTLQLRVRPFSSLLELDIPLIKRMFDNIDGVHSVEIIDNRRGDAFFITVLVELKEAVTAIKEIKKVIPSIPRVSFFLIDSHGNELSLISTEIEKALRYVKYMK